MKLSILFSFLTVGLVAFAVDVNSARVRYYHNGFELKGTEAPEPTDVTDATDATETTEPDESTDAPDNHVPDQLPIDEAHRFIEHLMDTVGQIVQSVVSACTSMLLKAHEKPIF
uniref:Uncharacterized protein n=1 Tax=Musca domestica TaxID=7370 RepID=A0A1I8MXV3_MUSDO